MEATGFQTFHVPSLFCKHTYSHVHKTRAAALASLKSTSSNSHKITNDKVTATVWCRQVMKSWVLHEYTKIKVQHTLMHTLSANYCSSFCKHAFLKFGTSSTEYKFRNEINKFQVIVSTWTFLRYSERTVNPVEDGPTPSRSFRTREIWDSFRAGRRKASLKRTVWI